MYWSQKYNIYLWNVSLKYKLAPYENSQEQVFQTSTVLEEIQFKVRMDPDNVIYYWST